MSTLDFASRPFEIEHPILVCPENQFAYTAVSDIAALQDAGGSVVTVFGPTGTGKTQLLREAARGYVRGNSTARIAQTTGHELAERIATAIGQRSLEQFRKEYAQIDLLLCDGLDEFPSSPSIQQQFLSVLDEILSNQGVILFTSSRPAGELRRLSGRIVNRCHGGIPAEVQLPGESSRRKLLQHFAEAYHINCPEQLVNKLARDFEVNGRELLSLLKRLYEFGRVRRRSLGSELLSEMLCGESDDEGIPLSRIAQVVAAEFDASLQEMRSGSRARRSLVSRQTAMLLAREMTETPLCEIGDYFGGRNHSTVVHACQRARILIERDTEVASAVAQIRQLLKESRRSRRRNRDRYPSTRGVRAG